MVKRQASRGYLALFDALLDDPRFRALSAVVDDKIVWLRNNALERLPIP